MECCTILFDHKVPMRQYIREVIDIASPRITKMVEKQLVSTILDTDLCQAFRSMNIPVIWNVLKRCRPKICSGIWLASELRALKVD